MRTETPASASDPVETDRPKAFHATSSVRRYEPIKAVFDMAVAIVLLIVLAPLILALMVLVKLASPGPAIYSQIRLGRNGRPFRIFKLRSMHHDCERHTGPRWSTSGDSRVTWLGGILRATHLDELPQLWNVVRGEMSLVGPRPERPEFVSQLELALPAYRERLQVRPGITGLAQVYLPPDVDVTSVRYKLSYDLCYLQNMGFWLDLRVIVATVFKMVGARWSVAAAWAMGLPRGESPTSTDPRNADQEESVLRLQAI